MALLFLLPLRPPPPLNSFGTIDGMKIIFFFYYDFIVKLDEHITVDDEVDRPPFIHSEAPEHYYCVLLFLYRMECISTCVDASLTLNHFIFACLVNRPTVLVTPLLLELWSHL